VTYIFHVERPDGVSPFNVTTDADEDGPCPNTDESVTRRVPESVEPLG